MQENGTTSIVDIILNLPTFQGITRDRLRLLVEKYPFQFAKYADGETVVVAGQPCDAAHFIVSGHARATARHDALNITLAYSLNAPDVLYDNRIFGLDTIYPATVTALGECGLMTITKHDYIDMMQNDRILLFNALNRLSRMSQAMESHARVLRHGTILQRLALFILPSIPTRATDITMQFAWPDICALLGTTKAKLQTAVNNAENGKSFTLSAPGTFTVDNRKTLRCLLD